MGRTYEEARARTDKIRTGFEEISRLQSLLPREKKQRSDDRSVYFIQADNGLIKIGVAAKPHDRLHALRTMSPVGLRLVLAMPGLDAPGEAELHTRFAEHRAHGEWFRAAPALVEFIRGQK